MQDKKVAKAMINKDIRWNKDLFINILNKYDDFKNGINGQSTATSDI